MRPTLAALLALLSIACTSPKANPIPVKVVVVTMFERGADTGDDPGEFQIWVEHEKLDRVIEFPQGFHNLRMSADGVLGTVTGVGTARAAANIMALGLDQRFDLSKAYWVVAGIAGVDPEDASVGSAAWAEWIVDGDLGYEIDAREIPKDWKTGYVPLKQAVPYQLPRRTDVGGIFHLQPSLVNWAVRLTRDVPLQDTEAMQKERMQYASANARRPPFVLKGDNVASSTFWAGKLLSRWANDWVEYHTGGQGNYVTTAMEDSGTMQSLEFLAKAGRVDVNRVLILRTASDFDQPAPGETPAQVLARNQFTKYAGYLPALDAAWRVGHVVVEDLVKHWDKYRDKTPE
jgi:purine nucleoside permease